MANNRGAVMLTFIHHDLLRVIISHFIFHKKCDTKIFISLLQYSYMYVKLNASGFPYFIEIECATCGIDVGVLHINSICITNVLLRLEHSFT